MTNTDMIVGYFSNNVPKLDDYYSVGQSTPSIQPASTVLNLISAESSRATGKTKITFTRLLSPTSTSG
jgi:hypothetical protein